MTLWQFNCTCDGFRMFHSGKSSDGSGAPSDEDLERAIREDAGETRTRTE